LKIRISTSTVIFALCLFATSVSGQQASNPPFDFPAHVDVPGEKSEEARYREMVRRNTEPSPRQGPTPEPRVLKKGPLAPSLQDRESYASFLRQPDTGLIRLLPMERGAAKSRSRPKIAGGGAYFSFSFRSHDYLGDIRLDNDLVCRGVVGGPPQCQYPRKLYAGSYGMLTHLGNVPLEELELNDPRARFLASYELALSPPKARCERLEFHKGVTIDSQIYKTALPIQVNSTYLLRATDHHVSDVLVAFRVVREDDLGGVTIAWKLLKQFKPRKLESVLYVSSSDKCPVN